MSHDAQRILLAGATGLVGGRVLAQLLADVHVNEVVVPTRRALAEHSTKLLPVTSAMDSPEALNELDETLIRVAPTLDVFISCLGSTLKQAGSKAAFLAVDRDLVVRLAQTARKLGARQAIFLSSVGASAQSGNFYLRVKGETERQLSGLGFTRIDFLHPGLLLGERSDSRPGEALAQRLSPYFNPLLVGAWQRYRAIDADVVARAVTQLLLFNQAGQFVHDYAALNQLALA